jgi:hypothetical protein
MRIATALIVVLAGGILQTAAAGPRTEAKATAPHGATPSRERPTIEVNGGLVTAEIHDAPLLNVLEAIASESDIRIVVGPMTDERVTIRFQDVPLDEALRRMLRGKSFTFVYSASSEDGTAHTLRLEEVYVITVGAAKVPSAAGASSAAGTSSAVRTAPTQRASPEADRAIAGTISERDGNLNAPAGAQTTAGVGDSRQNKAAAEDEKRRLLELAKEALARTGDPNVIALGHTALEDPDPSAHMKALRALAKNGADGAGPLTLALLGDTNSAVREVAAGALGRTKDGAAVNPLGWAVLNDSRRHVRAAAARALGQVNSDHGVQPLLQALGDRDQYVRLSSVRSLGAIGSTQAVPALIETSRRDASHWVRESAEQSVQKISARAAR